ncbi:MAG: DUF58 domain-containing protein [Candidatus Woesearchaeota archaeon]
MAVKELKVDLKPLIGQLHLSSSNDVTGALTGSYLTVYKGRGLEFGGYRQYTAADDASSIDWKASMRSEHILVRELVEERNLNVFFLFDVSNSMLFASTDKMKCEYAIELIATMAFAIIRAGDSVGISQFNDDVLNNINPNVGSAQYYKIVHELTNTQNYGGGFNLTKALRKTTLILRKQRAMIILVSDFLGLTDTAWEDYVKSISTRFDLLPIMIKDPVDMTLPEHKGELIIEDPYSREQIMVNPTSMKEEYEKNARQQENKIIQTFKKYNVEVLKLKTDKPFMRDLIGHIQRRRNK